MQVDRRVQRGLAAQGRQDRVGPLLGDDRLDDLPRDRLDVGGVGEVGVGHDRRRVGVDQDDAHALLAQHAARLRARVVELAGLADHDRAGADDQDALDVVALGHQLRLVLCWSSVVRDRPCRGSGRTGSWRRAGRPRPRGGTAPRTPGCRGVEALDDVVVEVDVAHLDPAEAVRAVELALDGAPRRRIRGCAR